MKSALTFRMEGQTAVGLLRSGQQFKVDASDVEKVSALSWRVNKGGYLSHYDRRTVNEILMHRWLMDVTDPHVIVDHVNRDRLDCTRSNLRLVTPTQNSANHGLFQTNKTGYTGVYYSKCAGRYEVKVGYGHRRILLGCTRNVENLVMLAQMYNIGATFFFGEYAGALNDVPEPPDDLAKAVIEKCRRYEKALGSVSA